MEIIATQKVISNNRIFIGPKLRGELDIKTGDFVNFVRDGDKIVVKKVEA